MKVSIADELLRSLAAWSNVLVSELNNVLLLLCFFFGSQSISNDTQSCSIKTELNSFVPFHHILS